MQQDNKIEIFIYYRIKPINPCFKDSLYRYLLENVWGDRREVEEDIRVMNEYYLSDDKPIDVVRYQFGDFDSAESYKDEVGELVDEHFNKWLAHNSNSEDVLFA